jgi:hypothetical protein
VEAKALRLADATGRAVAQRLAVYEGGKVIKPHPILVYDDGESLNKGAENDTAE